MKTIPLLFVIYALLFTACGSPDDGDTELASITISLGLSAGRAAAYPPDDATFKSLTHKIYLWNSSEKVTASLTLNQGKTQDSFKVSPGSYWVSIDAWLDNGLYATGWSDTFTVKAGETKGCSVEMKEADPNTEPTAPTDPPGGGTTTYPPPTIPPGAVEFTVANLADWNTAVNTIKGSGTNASGIYAIYLTGNFSLVYGYTAATFGTTPLGSTLSVYILGAHEISLTGTGRLLHIGARQEVTLHDTCLKGHAANNNPLVYVFGGSAAPSIFTMSGNSSVYGNTNTTTIFTGGGGGVYASNGIFTMQDGASVHDNNISGGNNWGGGVCVDGIGLTFTMRDNASVYNNNASFGGGVQASDGTFTMQDNASIHDNTSGGGVEIRDNVVFTMLGGKITGNTAGGGVLVAGATFNMLGGKIAGNTANSVGGGVYLTDADFYLQTGDITGNTATNNGAALYLTGTPPPIAEYGTFATPGDTTSTWTSNGTLSTTNNDIKVVDGVLQ